MVTWPSFLCLLQLVASPSVMAEQTLRPDSGMLPATAVTVPLSQKSAMTGALPSNLNLGATTKSVLAGGIAGFHPTAIRTGGAMQLVNSNSLLTPAQVLAVNQVLTSGQQNLLISGLGSAVGGSATISAGTNNTLSNMVIPHNVKVTSLLTDNVLNITGNLTNAGALYFAGNGQQLDVNANNINNLAGGVMASLQAGQNLTLHAVHNINNAGSISSGGNLTLSAGGTINNSGSLLANNNINLSSAIGNYVNSGSITASTGNINIASATSSTATSIDGLGGTLSALMGSINVGSSLDSKLNMSNGNYLSQALNLKGSNIEVNVGDVTGTVNVSGCEAHFLSATENLSLGVWDVSGDPLISNTGNIDISQTAALSGTEYVILAGGNITSNTDTFTINTSIGSTSTAKQGGTVMLGAGVNYKSPTILGPSKTGGDILLGNLTGTVINTSSAKANTPGGAVTLFAFANPNDALVGGHVVLGSTTKIQTGGNGTGKNGDVLVVAGATSTASVPLTVQVGAVDTTGGAAGSGSIGLYTSTPNTGSKGITIDTTLGTVKSGSFTGGALVNGAVSVGGSLTTNGGSVTVSSGKNAAGGNAITVNGAITTSSTTKAAGNVSLTATGTTGSNINVTGNITALSQVQGGNVTVASPGSLTLQAINTGDISTNLAGAAGNVVLNAGGTGSKNISFIGISASGTKGGLVEVVASGNITSNAASLGANQYNINSGGETTGSAGNVIVIAGVQSTLNGDGTLKTSTVSSSGGDLVFSGQATAVRSSVAASNTAGSAGSVTLAAEGVGTTAGKLNIGGSIEAKGGQLSSAVGKSGNVFISAGEASNATTPVTVQVLAIDTTNGTQAGGGDVTIKTGQIGDNLSYSASGTLTSGTINSGLDRNGAVSTGNISTTGANIVSTGSTGGNVLIRAGRNVSASTAVSTGAISTVSSTFGPGGLAGASNTGGSVIITSGIFGPNTNEDIVIGGNISTTGFSSASTGGEVRLVAGTNLNLSGTTITTGTSGSGAGGGAVTLLAGSNLQAGNITFKNISTTGIFGGAVEMIASGSISSSFLGVQIDSSGAINNQNGNGGNVILVAGASASTSTLGSVPTISISGSSGFAGNINLSNGSGTVIDTSFSGLFSNVIGSGGAVTLASYGTKVGTGTVTLTGDISTGSFYNGIFNSSTKVTTYIGGSGNVIVVAEGPSTSGPTINIQNVDTIGTLAGTGSINLVTASPAATALQPLVINDLSGNIISGNITGTKYVSGAVKAGNLATNGGSVTVNAGTNNTTFAIDLASVDTHANSTLGGSGGSVFLTSGLDGLTANSSIRVSGSILTQGFTITDPGVGAKPVTGIGGTVAILTPGDINVTNITTGDNTTSTSGVGANGGTVILFAGDTTLGSGNVTFTSIQTQGGSTNTAINNTGSGGDVEIVSIGTSGAINGTSITTNMISSTASGDAGSVTISSKGIITVPTISMKATLSTGRAGFAFLSSAASSGTVITANVDATTGSGNSQGSLFGFVNSSIASKFDGSIGNIGDFFITVTNAPTQLAVGMTVSGAGVPAGTFITGITYTGSNVTSVAINNAATGKGAATFNGASTNTINVSLASNFFPGFYATAPGALPAPGAGTILSFSAGTPSSIVQNPGNVKPVFFSAGGFTNINNTTDIAISGDSRLIVPIVSLGASGINWTNSATNTSSVSVAFFGTSITINGNTNRFLNPISAVAPGNITLNSTSVASSSLLLGTVVTPAKFTASIAQNISIQGQISASQVYLDSVGGSAPGTAPGGNITYNSSVLLPIFTNNLQINANGNVGDYTTAPGRPLNIQGRGDGISFHDSKAGSFAIQADGNLYLNTLSTTQTIYSGATPTVNSSGNMVIISTPNSQNQGSITFQNAIDTPYGDIFLVAAGSISTPAAASLTATGRLGTSPIPGGGGNIFVVAGATATMSAGSVSVLGRSGIGGDISLTGITDSSSFNTQTARDRTGGDIAIVAYSNTIAGLIGGTITIPTSSTIGIYSPGGTDTSSRGAFGLSIVGEASGGPTADVTITTGNLYGGIGSVNVATATPAGSAVTPVSISINSGDYAIKFFTGNLPNGSISTQKISVSGAGIVQNTDVSSIGQFQSGISVVAGGYVNTLDVTAIGLSGATPTISSTSIAPPYIPSNLNGYSGGAGGAVYVNGNLGVTINGPVLSFGGGGGGGSGAPYALNGTSTIVKNGGDGGSGGAGGVVAVQSNGNVLVNGGINSSGGGGGGGGGGVGGSGVSEHGIGGNGGAGGVAGNVTVTGGNQLGGTIQVAGDIFAVAGGRGGNGGTGMTGAPSGIFGGSGGGGGGSYGAGGGGGGAGVLEPTSANFSGLGGAGGGGVYGGGGGDTQNIVPTAGVPQQQSGFGGWGGGGYLPTIGVPSEAIGVYDAGVFGGAPNEGLTSPVNGLPYFATASSGNNQVGGFGGHYYVDSGLLSSGSSTLLPSAIGGTLGNGGSGGASANPSYVPAVQGEKDAFGLPGSDAVTTTGVGDGIVTMTANTFTTPSTISAGNIFLKTNGVGSTGAGNLTITGTLLASGKYSGISPNPNCTNCAITAWVGSTLSGNLIVNPSTTINSYSGRVLIENDNTSGLISIGSNSQIFAHTTGSQYGLSVSIGLPTWFQKSPTPAVQGSTPANVLAIISPTLKPANFVSYGTAGITAQGPQNTIFALGSTPLQVAFQSGGATGGNSKSITLGGGTQLGASSSVPISSLDLTDSSTVQTITGQQSSGVIGGTLTFTKNNNVFAVTGGTLVLYPINLTARLSALNIPNPSLPLSVTLTNFQTVNTINVNISDSSTSNNVVINSPLIFTGSTQPLAFNVNSNQGSTFGVNIDPTTGAAIAGKGSISTTGSLTFNVQGTTTINGAVTANAGTLAINNTLPGLPVNLTSSITASKGLSITTVGGDLIVGSGTLKTAGTGIAVSAAAVQFGTSSVVKATVTNTAGAFLVLASNGITVNSGSVVSSTSGINWLSTSGKVTINGALSSSGGTTVLSNQSVTPSDSTTIGANVSGSKGVTIISVPGFTQSAGTTISSSNAPITLEVPSSSGQLQLGGKVTAGSSTVTLSPSTFGQAISVGGAAAFNVSTANIAAITAGTLQIGDGNNTGTMTVSSPLDSSKFNLTFKSANNLGASFTSTGQTITMGVKNLTVSVGGAVNTGTISGGTIVSITGGTVNLNGAVQPKSALTISTVGSLGTGNIALGTGLSVLPSTLTLTAGGSNGGITGLPTGLTFPATVTTLTLGAGAGGFGVAPTVTTSAKTLSLSFPGTLTVNETASFSLGNSTVTDLVINNNAKSGVVTTTGTITGTNLTVNMQDPGKGSIVVGSAINESGNVALNASGTGTITSVLNKGVVTGNKVTLVSGTGAIGATSSPIVVAASQLSANTTNAVYLQNNSVGTLLASNGSIFSLVSKAQDTSAAITLGGNITATTSINLAATNATSGSISMGTFSLTVPGTTGVVTLTASGAGGITQTSGTISAAKSLTINSGVAGVSLATPTTAALLTVNAIGAVSVQDSSAVLTLGNSSGGASFSVTQTSTGINKMTVGAITARSITLDASAGSSNSIILNGVVAGVAGSSDINIKVNGSLTGSGTKLIGNGLLTISGTGATVGTATAPIGTAVSSYNVSSTLFNATNLGSVGGSISTGAGNLTLKTTGVSNIGSASAPLTTTVNGATSTITLSTLTNALVNVKNTGAAVNLGVGTAGLSFAFETTGSLNVLGVSTKAPITSLTGAGNITLINGAGAMNVNGNVQATGGSIVLQNKDTAAGTINIAASKQVTTLIKGATNTSQGSVSIGITAGAITKSNQVASLPGFVITTKNGGGIFAGANAGNIVPATPGKTANLQAIGADVIFDTTTAGRTISIGAGATVKADPIPLDAPARSGANLVSPVKSVTVSPSNAAPTIVPSASNNASTGMVNGFTSWVNNVATQTAATANKMADAVKSAVSQYIPNASGAKDEFSFVPENFILFDGSNVRTNSSADLMVDPSSDTVEASSEFKPAGLRTLLTPQLPTGMKNGSVRDFRKLGIDGKMNAGKLNLQRGSVLLVPKHDTVVETAFGSIKVNAGAVALVVVKSDSMSVYNFHDNHAGSVAASIGKQEMKLAPGHHITVSGLAAFEQVNPIGCISHRSLTSSLAGSHAVHTSEFSIMSALGGMKTWSAMKQSQDKNDVHIVHTVLKNAAIIMQVRKSSGGYREYRQSNPENIAMK